MNGLCGTLQPDLLPDWLSKIGPTIAASVALSIYVMNRWHARQDLKAQRRVLRAMLVGHISFALGRAESLQHYLHVRAGTDSKPVDQWPQKAMLGHFSIAGDRLFVLQEQLLSVADHGDEVVAEFIEACRDHQSFVDVIAKDPDDDKSLGALCDTMIDLRFGIMEGTIREILLRGPPARRHLDRLIKRETMG